MCGDNLEQECSASTGLDILLNIHPSAFLKKMKEVFLLYLREDKAKKLLSSFLEKRMDGYSIKCPVPLKLNILVLDYPHTFLLEQYH